MKQRATDLRGLLAPGDLRTTGRVGHVVAVVRRAPRLMAGLIGLLGDADPGVRMRAFDAVEKLSARDRRLISRYKRAILRSRSALDQQEVAWHWCQVVPRLPLGARERAAAFSTMNALRGADSRIVRTFALQGMFDLARGHPRLRARVRAALTADGRRGPPAVKARARRLLARLGER